MLSARSLGQMMMTLTCVVALARRRAESGFLAYLNHAGRYADFHSCRRFST